jgi:hypothetical protein
VPNPKSQHTKSRAPQVQVPPVEADQFNIVHVGIIAAVCFAIGVAWPLVWGASLVPSVPTRDADDKPKAKPKPDRPAAPDSPQREVPVTKTVPGEPASPAPGAELVKSLVVNCRDEQDRRLQSCDTPGFEAIARERLAALSSCPAVQGKSGLLSIGFDLDFSSQKITKFSSGKSSSFDDATVEGLLACAKREFLSATLKDVAHTHARYLVFYSVQFTPSGTAPSPEASDSVVAASGSATVIWNSARVRAEPDGSEIRERLLYGTRVMVTGRQGDWYRVRYDAKGNEGWVHKNALAL